MLIPCNVTCTFYPATMMMGCTRFHHKTQGEGIMCTGGRVTESQITDVVQFMPLPNGTTQYPWIQLANLPVTTDRNAVFTLK